MWALCGSAQYRRRVRGLILTVASYEERSLVSVLVILSLNTRSENEVCYHACIQMGGWMNELMDRWRDE